MAAIIPILGTLSREKFRKSEKPARRRRVKRLLPPPALNWILSSGYNGSCVRAASRLARVDFPPPAFPNTATLLIPHALSRCRPRQARSRLLTQGAIFFGATSHR
jgi:hypothetical protein